MCMVVDLFLVVFFCGVDVIVFCDFENCKFFGNCWVNVDRFIEVFFRRVYFYRYGVVLCYFFGIWF